MPRLPLSSWREALRRAAQRRDQRAVPETKRTTVPRIAVTREEGTWDGALHLVGADEEAAEDD